ncbi:MAG TPA: hypothetical protein PLA74_01025, partial [Syntrophales bacterium]|nr:hypothetical protein [Syntrophales bacterium]
YTEGDHLRITNMYRVVPHLDLWVNEQYDNTLTLGNGKLLKLPSLAGDTLLRVFIEKMTFLEYIYVRAKIFT